VKKVLVAALDLFGVQSYSIHHQDLAAR